MFAPELWGADGVWTYEVQGEMHAENAKADVTFKEVVDWHPVIRKWVDVVEKEMGRAGIGRGRFEGVEWEKGRMSGGTEDL